MPPRTRPSAPVPCDCATRRHRHGTDLMYHMHRCGCDPCRLANNKARRDRDREGTPRSVPADDARTILQSYLDAGHPIVRVAEITGLSMRNLQTLHSGEKARVFTATYDALAGARRALPAPSATKMDATGTARRIRALTAIGWPARHIADRAGVDRNMVQFLRSGRQTVCSAASMQAIRAIYDELWNQTPPEVTQPEKRMAAVARNTAARNGWLPPLAWDDDQIDDPTHTPNVTALGKRRTRDEAAHDRLDDLTHLIEAGIPAEEAVTRAGYPTMKAAYEAAKHRGLDRIVPHLLSQAA